MKRAPDVNGFTKVDSMHIPFTRAYFKLVAALHCFNPDVCANFAKIISPQGIHLKSFLLKELEPFVSLCGSHSHERRTHSLVCVPQRIEHAHFLGPATQFLCSRGVPRS